MNYKFKDCDRKATEGLVQQAAWQYFAAVGNAVMKLKQYAILVSRRCFFLNNGRSVHHYFRGNIINLSSIQSQRFAGWSRRHNRGVRDSR